MCTVRVSLSRRPGRYWNCLLRWSFDQIIDTSSDNIRPLVTDGSGEEALLWMQGSYSSYTDFNTKVVGLVEPISVPEPTSLGLLGIASLASLARRHRR